MDNNYITTLESLHNQNVKMIMESATIETMLESVTKSLEVYETYIPEFFSKRGSSDGIKSLYENLHNPIISERTINCVDSTDVFSVYNEYSDGMIDFVKEVIVNYNTNEKFMTESSLFNEKLNIAKREDHNFVKSMFGGKHNPSKDMVLSEAVHNIECLIDFIPQVSEFKTTCKTITESIDNISDNNELVLGCIQLLFESVENYCYETVCNIVTTYDNITKVASEPVVKKIDKTTFSLF